MAGGMINHIRILETKPPEQTIRQWGRIRRGTMEVMGLHWHRNMLPLHFAANAGNVYHMQRRTKRYLDIKAKAAQRGVVGKRIVDRRAATDALTLSGTLRNNVTQVATIRVFEQRFTLIMPGTSYTPDRPRSPRQPPIAQEATRLLAREKEELAKLGKAYAVKELNL